MGDVCPVACTAWFPEQAKQNGRRRPPGRSEKQQAHRCCLLHAPHEPASPAACATELRRGCRGSRGWELRRAWLKGGCMDAGRGLSHSCACAGLKQRCSAGALAAWPPSAPSPGAASRPGPMSACACTASGRRVAGAGPAFQVGGRGSVHEAAKLPWNGTGAAPYTPACCSLDMHGQDKWRCLVTTDVGASWRRIFG